jgi:hypothetical protein
MRGEYVESQSSRFEVASDTLSQQRYQAVLDTYEVVKEIPAFGGLVLGGSLSKGRVLDEESAKVVDIDLTAFIDLEVTQQQRYNYDLLEIRIKRALEDGIAINMAKQTGDFLSLSFPSRRVFVDIETFAIANNGRSSILTQIEALKRVLDRYPGTFEERGLSIVVASYFGMQIGDLLRPYHEAFFEQLGEKDNAEELWGTVYGSIVRSERKSGGVPEGIKDQFPHTLELARSMYM